MPVIGGNKDTPIAFKNCTAFTRYVRHIYYEHVETAENIDIITSMYKLLEYSDNYAESSGSLSQYKRDEQNMTAVGNPDNINTNDSSSFKYKSSFLKELTSRAVAAKY